MATRLCLVAAILTASLAHAGQAAPEFCVEAAVPSHGEKYYQPRAEGRYCDGITFERHSKSGLLPVLAVATGVEGEGLPAATVGVLAPGTQGGPIRIRGIALDVGLNYRLDAELTTGTRLHLGPESGLAKVAALDLAAVGWLAWVDSDSGARYLPALDGSVSAEAIRITVRPGIHTAYVLYSVEDASGEGLVEQTEADRDVDAHTNVAFSIPGRGPSPILVKILAVGKAGRRESAGLWIERRGPSGGT